MELDPQVSPEEIMSRAVELLRKLDFFRFRLSLNSSATDIVLVTLPNTAVETAITQCTSRWAMARGHRLNTSVVLAAVHGLSGLLWAVSAVEPSLFRPLPLLPPSLISHLASVDIKQYGQGHEVVTTEFRSCVKEEMADLGSPSLIKQSVRSLWTSTTLKLQNSGAV